MILIQKKGGVLKRFDKLFLGWANESQKSVIIGGIHQEICHWSRGKN